MDKSEGSKYEVFATSLLHNLGAEVAMVIVIGGKLGSGFSRVERAQADPEMTEQLRKAQAAVLRHVARDIDKGITQPDEMQHRRGST